MQTTREKEREKGSERERKWENRLPKRSIRGRTLTHSLANTAACRTSTSAACGPSTVSGAAGHRGKTSDGLENGKRGNETGRREGTGDWCHLSCGRCSQTANTLTRACRPSSAARPRRRAGQLAQRAGCSAGQPAPEEGQEPLHCKGGEVEVCPWAARSLAACSHPHPLTHFPSPPLYPGAQGPRTDPPRQDR